ncbi:hypothetical protein JOB18_029794 [Solea senegalensis]|uniref:Uncharacterized protein n=1 Tax=Solea senegalensis TaxID=28829 RepID=A0AAV6QXT9_SOLSE|nr:hypothetical protein JOB18_029794 [Solea senegalensis]
MAGKENKSRYCSRLVWAQRTSTDELSTEFLTQWCQSRDCDVRRTQVNSIAPAGNMEQSQLIIPNGWGQRGHSFQWCVGEDKRQQHQAACWHLHETKRGASFLSSFLRHQPQDEA